MRRILPLTFILALLLTATACTKPAPPRTADGAIVGSTADYQYLRYDSPPHILLTKYTGGGGNVAVPSRLEGVPVTALGSYVFSWTAVETVTIPDGVTAIGAGAFENCGELGAVTLPKTLETLGDGAFVSCTELSDITLDPACAAYQVRDGVLYADGGRTLQLYPSGLTAADFTIPAGVTRVARRAFEGQPTLRQLVLPEGLTHIEDAAFAQCVSLAQIALPGTLVSLGVGAFSSSGLIALQLPDSLSALPDQLCWGCDMLYELTLPASLDSIGDSAFRECTSLLELTLPDTLTTIGSVAFYACELLERVTIPPRVSALPLQVFGLCGSLADITIPATVTAIHEAALNGVEAEGLRVHGAAGSEAERFAQAAGYAFVAQE